MKRLRWPSIAVPRVSSLKAILNGRIIGRATRTCSKSSTTLPWNLISNELALWRREGLRPKLWWRDDDVTRPSRNLDRLLELRRLRHVPLALAAIPAHATPDLASRLRGEPDVCILVHGLDHSNRVNDSFSPKVRISGGRRRCRTRGNRFEGASLALPWGGGCADICAALV